MSNFQCPHCGMTNIDCGKDGYKTPREIELEKKLKEINKIAENAYSLTNYTNKDMADFAKKVMIKCT